MTAARLVQECQDHLLTTAAAHVERWVLEQFVDAIERCEDSDLSATLSSLCDLFALWRIELDRGCFLEQGYLEAGKAKAVRKLVNRLCKEMAPQALALVNAFGIPDCCLGAPIAT